jgi:hypothetical protein
MDESSSEGWALVSFAYAWEQHLMLSAELLLEDRWFVDESALVSSASALGVHHLQVWEELLLD